MSSGHVRHWEMVLRDYCEGEEDVTHHNVYEVACEAVARNVAYEEVFVQVRKELSEAQRVVKASGETDYSRGQADGIRRVLRILKERFGGQ